MTYSIKANRIEYALSVNDEYNEIGNPFDRCFGANSKTATGVDLRICVCVISFLTPLAN